MQPNEPTRGRWIFDQPVKVYVSENNTSAEAAVEAVQQGLAGKVIVRKARSGKSSPFQVEVFSSPPPSDGVFVLHLTRSTFLGVNAVTIAADVRDARSAGLQLLRLKTSC